MVPIHRLSNIDFTTTKFLIPIHGLAFIYMLNENALIFGNLLGTVIDIVFSNNENPIIEKYLRLRVLINVNSNIKLGYFHSKKDGSVYWFQFRFDRFPDFYFKCFFLYYIKNIIALTSKKFFYVW